MTVELIDSHAHLDYEFEQDVPTMLANAFSEGITHVIAIAAEPGSLPRVHDLAEQHDNVFHTAGIHPHDATEFSDEVMAEVKRFAGKPKCVAVGELGLDYFYDHSPRQVQWRALETQLEFSVACGKPVVVHTREADDDTVKALTEHAGAWKAVHPDRIPGVIHCFASSAELAEKCLGLGYSISFSGIVTFRNAEELRRIAKEIVPMERMLVETDSPYLTPVPYRGKQNQPARTRQVAEKIAELKSLPLEEVAAITRRNTIDLFQLPL